MDPCQHVHTGASRVYARGEGPDASTLIPPAVSPLGPMPMCQSVCFLPVCLPAAPIQITIMEHARAGQEKAFRWYTQKEASPEESAPPRGKNLASIDFHQLGRAGSRDMMHSLGGSWSASVFSAQEPRQLLIACG